MDARISALVMAGLAMACGSSSSAPDAAVVPDADGVADAAAAPDASVDAMVPDTSPPMPRALCVLDGTTLMTLESTTGAELRRGTLSPAIVEINDERRDLLVDPGRGEVFLINSNGVAVYRRDATGSDLPVRHVQRWARRAALDLVHDELIVQWFNEVVVLPRTADGTTAPLRTFTLPDGDAYTALAVDPARDEILVGTNTELRIYARTATGTPSPLRVLPGTTYGIHVDARNDELWIERLSTVEVYRRGAEPTAAPLRSLETGVIQDLALDLDHDEVWVRQSRQLQAYGRTASGAAAPLRSATLPNIVRGVGAMAVDPVAGEVLWANPGSLHVFPRTATGAVAPVRSLLSGDNRTALVGLDRARDQILLAHTGGAVAAYPRTATGALTSARVLWGPGDALHVIDNGHDELATADSSLISTFSLAGDDYREPVRTLAVGRIQALAAFPAADELAISDGLRTVALYPRDAVTPAAPTRSFQIADVPPGCTTYLRGLAASTAHDEIVVLATGCCGHIEDRPIVCSHQVQAYPRTATGAPAPTRVFALTRPDDGVFSGGVYVEVDERNDRILVAEGGMLEAYPRTASGTPSPLVHYPIPGHAFWYRPRMRLCD